MQFRNVFLAIVLGTAIVVAAILVHRARPVSERNRPSREAVAATGRCAECHRAETGAIVHEYEISRHAAVGVSCLDCHRPLDRQEAVEHRGFTITNVVTSGSCRECHTTQYDQFVRSRHGAPAWAAVRGPADFTAEQVAFAERYHPGAVNRPANQLALMEGPGALTSGCLGCHDIGQPNADGSIGSCTECHARHEASVALARQPETCGQCHMGPDHSQLEIYNESKHGILFRLRRDELNLDARPSTLTVEDMPVPTCATCHMSGLGGRNFTHDVSERLGYWLFAPVSDRRPGFEQARARMQEICANCHARPQIERFYAQADTVVIATNAKVAAADSLVQRLYRERRLTPEPFDEPIEFVHFDLWHYYGRTAKHGAFMGGPDFVQWHGNYELLQLGVELRHMAAETRAHQ